MSTFELCQKIEYVHVQDLPAASLKERSPFLSMTPLEEENSS